MFDACNSAVLYVMHYSVSSGAELTAGAGKSVYIHLHSPAEQTDRRERNEPFQTLLSQISFTKLNHYFSKRE